MSVSDDNRFPDEVSDRLNSLFGDSPPATQIEIDPATISQDREPPIDAPASARFSNLKAVILSIEWEISDETMNALLAEVRHLEAISSKQPLIVSFLRLLNSVGGYIARKKERAHPDSIRLLHSVYDRLETVLMSADMHPSDIKKILAEEIQKFNRLKQQLLSKVPPSSSVPDGDENTTAPPSGPDHGETGRMTDGTDHPATPEVNREPFHAGAAASDPAILARLNEIETLLVNEFKKIREDLKRIR